MPDESTAFRPPEETPTVTVGHREARALQLTPGTVLGERYRIVSLIGQGGMGEVYRADDLKLGQSVALKFLARHGNAERLYEEVRIGRQVSHPNVCRLYDIAEIEGHLFITMEFVDGEDLASLLRRVGRLPSEKALAVSRDICAGVGAAHEKGVIHRDLKPANVMIDGRGRARVTDFGLAVAGESRSDGAGTPAYMAPEQLAGQSASVKSDIYAVGLVLYEVFTGRRTFEATSTHDLVLRQQKADFTRPSLVTRDVPAAVERVITRCLDPNPDARPDSVEDILRELPGGDPLAAAIAAGETPTPGMVAAAAKTGDLSALLAWSMLAIAVAGIGLSAIVSERTLLHDVAGMKAPDVLQEHARQILADAGSKDRPRDSDLFVEAGPTIVYRQSRWTMRSFNANGTLRIFDPPLDVAKGGNARNQGMANVELDAGGQLLRFFVVPPTMEKRGSPIEPDWTPFLTAAGFDPRLLTRTEPQWAARVDSDHKLAWLTKDGKRIEAASYHGRPVAFEVITSDFIRYATTPPALPSFLAEKLATVMEIIFLIALPTAGIILARANLRSRRGDRAGAFRLATFFFLVMLVGLVFQAHHPMRFVDEWIITSWHVAQATFWALITALMYIAVEPFVRRRWPQILISWTRLLAGRFADPMVGRDVLMGAAGGTIAIAVWQATLLIAGVTTFLNPHTLGPARFVVAEVASTLGEALLRGVGLVILLVILRAVIPSDVIASVLTILLIATMTLGDTYGPLWLRGFYALSAAVTGVMLARHFGMLSVMSYVFFVLIQQRVPLTFDNDAWYFGRSVLVMLVLVALTVYAFRVSLGSKRWLPRFAFE